MEHALKVKNVSGPHESELHDGGFSDELQVPQDAPAESGDAYFAFSGMHYFGPGSANLNLMLEICGAQQHDRRPTLCQGNG
jgi:hypothetical protein